MKINPQLKKRTIFLKNFVGGLGWMIGATIGFALFIAFFGLILKWLGGLPLIGNFFAALIEATNKALESESVLFAPR